MVFAALYWRRATRAGAFASFLGGTAGCVLWIAFGLKEATGLHEIVPGFALSLVLMIGVSLATRPPAGSDDLLRAMTAPERQTDEPGPA